MNLKNEIENYLMLDDLDLESPPLKIIPKIKKNKPLLKNIFEQTSFMNENCSIAQRLWHIKHNLLELNKCKYNSQPKFNSFSKGYFTGCSKSCQCVKDAQKHSNDHLTPEKKRSINEKRENTSLEKYGVKNFAQTKESKHKTKKTNKTRYGSENPMQNSIIIEKYKHTFNEKYGVDNPAKIQAVKNKNSNSQIEKSKEKYEDYIREFGFELQEEFKGFHKSHIFKHTDCGNVFEWNPRSGYKSIPHCNICHTSHITSSKAEEELREFLKSILDDRILSNNRTLIPPKEVDIYIPSKYLAIEYCGLYWHSESNEKDKWYHFNKWKECNDKGIRLLTIWDSEWINKQEIVKNRLKHILGNEKGIGARKCEIKEIELSQTREFCEVNHLHGYQQSSVKLGAFYEDELVGVMTFGKRKITGGISEWEIMRFCTSCNVVGLASRFVGKFKKDYHPEKLVSYSDNRWDTGKVYENMGFEKTNTPSPGYWYTSNFLSLEHRYKFRKKRLVEQGADSSLTEKEIMVSLGYSRVWDCGVTRWELDLNKKE